MTEYNLFEDGAQVINAFDQIETVEFERLFEEAENDYTTLIRNEHNDEILNRYGIGFSNTGMYNLPETFHDSYAKYIRKKCQTVLVPFFKNFIEKNNLPYRYFQQGFDRRRKTKIGKSPGGNNTSFHRDDLGAHEGREILIIGGWLNCSQHLQHLSIVLRTHNDPEGPTGFYTIKDQTLIRQYARDKTIIPIQPGQIVLFYQRAVHEIYKEKLETRRDYNIYKQYLASVLTVEKEPLFENTNEIIKNQDVPRLPGGGAVRMYSKIHKVNWTDRLREFSSCFIPECKNGDFVKEILPSLKSIGVMYDEYDEEDKSILKPDNKWIINVDDQQHVLSLYTT